MLVGCQEFDYGVTNETFVKKEYAETFSKVFGDNVDPTQTWSTASRSTLEVNINMPSTYDDCTVKVYTANPRGDVKNSYLLGEWKVANGSSSKLTFDMPSDLKTAWVAIVNKDGGRIVKEAAIKNNSCKTEFNLVPSTTRSAFKNLVTVTTSTDWTYFPLDVYYNSDAEKNSFIEVYPENNLDYSLGLCTDFEFVATGDDDIRMTYFYSNTTGTDKVYFFKYDPDIETLEQAYADKTNHKAIDAVSAKQNIEFHWASGGQSWAVGAGGDVDKNLKNGTYGPDENGKVGRGHTVTISGLEAGEHIVFYLYQSTPQYNAGSDQIAATRSAINQKFHLNSLNKDVNAQFAGVLTVNGVTYLGFEDALICTAGEKPNAYYDINDVVFTVTGGYTIEDHEDKIEQAMSYIIAYEDLGGSFDFDFNDIVLKATHVAGRNTATLTVLAAGGTLPVAISYDGETVCSDVHAEFGQSTTTVINAMPGQHSQYGTRSFTVTGIDADHPFALNKISITVTRDEENISTIHSPQYYTNSIPDDAHQVGAEEDTSIPYAILIANPNWDWCDENVSIATQEGFVDWVEDASKCQWYEQGNTWGKSEEESGNYPSAPSGYGTELTAENDGLTINDNADWDINAIFSTSSLPTTGTVTITVELEKGTEAAYFYANAKGLYGSTDGTNFSTSIAQNNDYSTDLTKGIAQYTIAASAYSSYTYLKFVVDAGKGTRITKVSFKSVE